MTALERRILWLLVGAIAAIALVCSCSGSELDNYTRSDKREHAACGFAIGAFGYLMADEIKPEWPDWKKVAAGTALAALAGIAKEAADHEDPKHHSCEARDAIATTAGGVIGAVSVSLVFRF